MSLFLLVHRLVDSLRLRTLFVLETRRFACQRIHLAGCELLLRAGEQIGRFAQLFGSPTRRIGVLLGPPLRFMASVAS